jgi:hypothetical protein
MHLANDTGYRFIFSRFHEELDAAEALGTMA